MHILLKGISYSPEILTSLLFTRVTPPPKKKKYYRTWLSPWNVPSSRKVNIHFLNNQKILFPAMK